MLAVISNMLYYSVLQMANFRLIADLGKESRYAKFHVYRGRITQKSEVTRYKAQRKIFSATLTDVSGEVQVIFFDSLATA